MPYFFCTCCQEDTYHYLPDGTPVCSYSLLEEAGELLHCCTFAHTNLYFFLSVYYPILHLAFFLLPIHYRTYLCLSPMHKFHDSGRSAV